MMISQTQCQSIAIHKETILQSVHKQYHCKCLFCLVQTYSIQTIDLYINAKIYIRFIQQSSHSYLTLRVLKLLVYHSFNFQLSVFLSVVQGRPKMSLFMNNCTFVRTHSNYIIVAMLKLGIICHRQFYSKVKASLKLLQITPPTTKKQIKTKYFQLAKSLHPDVKEQQGKAKSPKQIKQDSHLFVEVTKAYKHLSQLSEQEINRSEKQYEGRQRMAQSGGDSGSNGTRGMSEEQRQRRATYSFFNRKNSQNQTDGQNQEPLYKQMPQLFIGLILTLVFVAECGYLAYKQSKENVKRSDPREHSKTLENLNFKQKFNKNVQLQQND